MGLNQSKFEKQTDGKVMPNHKNYISPESYKVIKAHLDTAAKQSYAFCNTQSSFQYLKSIQWISWKLKLCY